MNRRELLIVLGGSGSFSPLAALAQQKGNPVIGILGGGSSSAFAPFVTAFQDGLGETGYVEGQNVVIEHRWAEGNYDRLPALAADLVSRKVDVIAAMGGTPSALAAKRATSSIPIVFLVADPVASGLVANLARPSGNLTGIEMFTIELIAKRLELLAELVPKARVIAQLVNPTSPIAENLVQNAQEAARAKGVELLILKAAVESEIDAAFAALVGLHAGALIVMADPFIDGRREQLVKLAARHAVPVIYPLREYAEAGGLISYGASFTPIFRQAGVYAGKILKGAKPAEIPVQRPTKFELVINLKTAKALGVTVPQALLARADEVIE